jgi:hypothetical protein
VENIKISHLPFYLFYEIATFSISSIVDVLKLSHVCQNWRDLIYSPDGPELWKYLKEKIPTIKEMKVLWKDRWVQLLSKNF